MAKKKSIAVPALIGVGAVAAYFLYSRKASAAGPLGDLPTADDPTPTPTPGKGKPKKGNAPKFPFAAGGNKMLESGAATSEHAQWMSLMSEVMEAQGTDPPPDAAAINTGRGIQSIPSNQTVAEYLADEAFNAIYPGVGKIGTGTSWKPFVDSWVRMHNQIKAMGWVKA